jgi:hypothetical protein
VALDKKERLYNETVEVVGRLANQQTPIDDTSADYARFWQLYRPELIGVESKEFAAKMIYIGAALKRLAESKSPPNDDLRRSAAELAEIARREIEAGSPPAAAN